jgi:hypothetical protein
MGIATLSFACSEAALSFGFCVGMVVVTAGSSKLIPMARFRLMPGGTNLFDDLAPGDWLIVKS